MKVSMIIYIMITYPNSRLFYFPTYLQVPLDSYSLILILQTELCALVSCFQLGTSSSVWEETILAEGLPPSHWSVGKSVWALFCLVIDLGELSPLWIVLYIGGHAWDI